MYNAAGSVTVQRRAYVRIRMQQTHSQVATAFAAHMWSSINYWAEYDYILFWQERSAVVLAEAHQLSVHVQGLGIAVKAIKKLCWVLYV